MTDQVRAALEALLSQWDAEAGAMPDSRVRTVLQSCAMEVRAILLDPVIARAALAAASPEPERCATCGQSRDGLKHRCWSTHFRRVREAGDGLHVTTDCHPFQPAPAAPTVEALRAELVAKLTSGWDMDPYGMYEIARADLLSDLDALEAAVRADERTRMDAPLAVDAGPEPRHMPVICCRWHAIAGQPR